MKTVKEVSTKFRVELKSLYDTREIDSLCNIALAEVADISSAQIKAFPEMELTGAQSEEIDKLLIRLKTGEPLQYIIGHTEFYGLQFKVNPSVLIPRPETEELVEWILSIVDPDQYILGNILDIGTGSGCIAISLKKYLESFAVYAVDISSEALLTAKQNAEINNVEIDFIQNDILNLNNQSEIYGKYTAIVSNPPYVTIEDKKQMHSNVTDFEPHTALFVPENDPLIFYKAIADFAANHLEEYGLLFFEINENYGEQTVELLKDKLFEGIELKKDMSGRDRMIKAYKVSF